MVFNHRGPLVLAGIGSFGALLYIYGAYEQARYLLRAANLVTLSRLALTLLLLGTATVSGNDLFTDIFIVLISLYVLIADGIDGWLARKRNEETEFGEYLDKEIDAFFLLALCITAYWQDKVGLWIILPGLLRYLFVVVLKFAAPPASKEYRSRSARVIYVVMVCTLISVFVLPSWIYGPALIFSTIALIWSFARYFRWLLKETYPSLFPLLPASVLAILSFIFLNTLLFIPALITNLDTSSFFPSPSADWTASTSSHLGTMIPFLFQRPNQDLFRLSIDLIALLTLAQIIRKPSFIRWIAAPLFVALLTYEVYDAIAQSFFHRPGILLEDSQYGLNLFYLLRDALSIEHAPLFITSLCGIALLIWSIPKAFFSISNGFKSPAFLSSAWVFSILFWPSVAVTGIGFGFTDERPALRLISAKIVANASHSAELKQNIDAYPTLPVDSSYSFYNERPVLSKPDVYLILIESYGHIVYENEEVKSLFQTIIDSHEKELTASGWHTASHQSLAPVSGGLSWLSMSSVLSGMRIDNRALHTEFLDHVNEYPHLVQYMNSNGYSTITLQPPNRERPGLPITNPFEFKETVYFDDLDYTGSPFGVWIIPDQYSLNKTHHDYIKDHSAPVFLFFETASTHAPWNAPPPLKADWRSLNTASPGASEAPIKPDSSKTSLFEHLHTLYRDHFTSDLSQMAKAYTAALSYDLDVLSQYIIHSADTNSIFIIMGDHQPPLLSNSSYYTPIHVITQDSTLLERFSFFGFQEGLYPSSFTPNPLTHAGVFSMLVDVLSPSIPTALPSSSFRPDGIPPSILPW